MGRFNVQDYGAVGDGVTNDSAAFLAAQDDVQTFGGVVVVPWTLNGYAIGDDTTKGTGIEITKPCTWKGENRVQLIHRAINNTGTNGQHFLFTIGARDGVRSVGADGVSISGFTIKGNTALNQRGISMEGICNDILIEDIVGIDVRDSLIIYGDANDATSTYSNITVRRIRRSGQVSNSDPQPAIQFFPRKNSGTANDQPSASGLLIEDVFIDMTDDRPGAGIADCIKINKTSAVWLDTIEVVRGGVGLDLVNGVQNVVAGKIICRESQAGVVIDSHFHPSVPGLVKTQRVSIGEIVYERESVSTPGSNALSISAGPEQVWIGSVVAKNADVSFLSPVQPADPSNPNPDPDHALSDCYIGSINLNGGNVRSLDPGSSRQPVERLHVGSIVCSQGGFASKGRVSLGDVNRKFNDCRFDRIVVKEHDGHGVIVRGENNWVGDITSIDGNPNGQTDIAVVAGIQEAHNRYGRIEIQGSNHDVRYFYLCVVPLNGGWAIGELFGDPINKEGIRIVSHENLDAVLATHSVDSSPLDLSGPAVDNYIFTADKDYYIMSIETVYTEGSSSDIGVDVRVGKNGVNTHFFDKPSLVNKTQFSSRAYLNTTGSQSFSNRKLAKGEVLTIGTAGGKVGGGEVVVKVNLS